MKTLFIAFIRNVMLGRRQLTQPLLLEAFSKHGAMNAVSYFTTGNVSFKLEEKKITQLKNKVENELNEIT